MLLARLFSYGDAHRARLSANYEQIPVNAPVAPVNTYSKNRVMRMVTGVRPAPWTWV
jgi:catalase